MSAPSRMPREAEVRPAGVECAPAPAAVPPRTWIFVESADESCDLFLVGGCGAAESTLPGPWSPACPLWCGYVGWLSRRPAG